MLFQEPLIVQKAADFNPEQDTKLLEYLIIKEKTRCLSNKKTADFFYRLILRLIIYFLKNL